jgi:hypothetical protein
MRDRLRSNYRGNVGGVPAAEPKVPEYWRIEPALNFGLHTPIAATATQKAMSETSANDIEYRGYTLTAVRYGPGWRVQIYPGPGRPLRTRPGHILAPTKEEAFAKARAIIDHHLLG